jgi:predicted PurR-regulated permease PerM
MNLNLKLLTFISYFLLLSLVFIILDFKQSPNLTYKIHNYISKHQSEIRDLNKQYQNLDKIFKYILKSSDCRIFQKLQEKSTNSKLNLYNRLKKRIILYKIRMRINRIYKS